jgi:hypothetical protein
VCSVTVPAIIDTGAAVTCIDGTILKGLGLSPIGFGVVMVPTRAAPARAIYYRVELTVLHPSSARTMDLIISQQEVAELAVGHTGTSVVIGQDVLARCDFHYSGPSDIFSLAY